MNRLNTTHALRSQGIASRAIKRAMKKSQTVTSQAGKNKCQLLY